MALPGEKSQSEVDTGVEQANARIGNILISNYHFWISWCGRRDSNPHSCYRTATSTLRVYQFRHDRKPRQGAARIAWAIWLVKRILTGWSSRGTSRAEGANKALKW